MEAEVAEKVKLLQDHMPLLIDWGTRLVSAILIIAAGFIVGNWMQRRVVNFRRMDPTLGGFLGGFVKYTIVSVAVIAVLAQFGVQTASLLAVLGAAGLAIGLAMQGTLSNVAAGAMLLLLRPFRVGDAIMVEGTVGVVKHLGLFGTELAMIDNTYLFMPNGKIWNANIVNYTRNMHRRQDIAVGISYDDDIGKAIKIIGEVLAKDERIVKDNDDMKAQVLTNAMSDFSIDLIVRFWTRYQDYWDVKFDVTRQIKEALDAGGVTIPFPTRTLHVVGNQEIQGKQAKQA